MTTKKSVKPEKKSTKVFDYKTINSFESACKKENINPELLPDVSMIPEEFRSDIINTYKLLVIFKAINNGWVADFSNSSQTKYYPWFWVLSSGFGFDGSDYRCRGANAGCGSRLCTDTSDKALFIAKTFEEIYKGLILVQK